MCDRDFLILNITFMNRHVRKGMCRIRVFTLVLLAILLSAHFETKAQNTIAITGTVTGENNQPLAGVAVEGQKSKLATTTNTAGSFSLNAPSNATLMFSYVGYTDTTIALNGRTSLTVQLSAGASQLNQVVVIGYGTATKRDLTGSIARVAGKDVADKPNANPLASL